MGCTARNAKNEGAEVVCRITSSVNQDAQTARAFAVGVMFSQRVE